MTAELDPTDLEAAQLSAEEVGRQRQIREAKEAEDWRWLMTSEHGRRIVRDLLETTGVHRTSFDQNALSMAFNEGQRNVGLRIEARIAKHAPLTYQLMVNEGK